MRVGAFESPMSQLSQEFLFVFIAPLENLLHHLEVGGNSFFGLITSWKCRNFEISDLQNLKKSSKFFSLKIVAKLFSHVFALSFVTFRRQNTFFIKHTTTQIHFFWHIKWHNFEISDLKISKKVQNFFSPKIVVQLDFTWWKMEETYCKKPRVWEAIQCNKPS